MPDSVVDRETLTAAVERACRAPSLHNSQPWRWVAEGALLHLFAEPDRVGRATDHTGREVLISCGAVLDHLHVVMAGAGWQTFVDRLPDPNHLNHLATVGFSRAAFVTDGARSRAEAVMRRRTDRLPFTPPEHWNEVEPVLRAAVDTSAADLDVLDDDARSQLAEASRLSEAVRRYDSSYHAELRWWTNQEGPQGIPPTSLPTQEEGSRVDVSRSSFPSGAAAAPGAGIERDHARVLVLSTYDDSRLRALRCGEELSKVLLECTLAGLATCTLTHMIEGQQQPRSGAPAHRTQVTAAAADPSRHSASHRAIRADHTAPTGGRRAAIPAVARRTPAVSAERVGASCGAGLSAS